MARKSMEWMTKLQRNKRLRKEVQCLLWGVALVSTFQGVQRFSHAMPAPALQPVDSVAWAVPQPQAGTYQFRVARPAAADSEIKVSLVGWKQLPDGTRDTSTTVSVGKFGPEETEKTITVDIAPGAVHDANNPNRSYIGDAANQFFISDKINATVHFSETDRNLKLRLDVANPFTVSATQHPQTSQAVSLPTLTTRHSDAATLNEDNQPNRLRPLHSAMLMSATDKNNDVLGTLSVTIETVAPKK